MKKRLTIVILVLLILLLTPVCVVFVLNKVRLESFAFLDKMGTGINLGNSLDCVGRAYSHKLETPEDYETYWGNPPVTEKWFATVKENGFGTVRIPVSWGEHQDEDGLIDSKWMARVKEVVDLALEQDLYVILDTHHEDWLITTDEKKEEYAERLCRIWEQIAGEFAEYDEKLLFEGLNEPRLRNTDLEWTIGTERSQNVVNYLNRRFVETVRAAGGNNGKRYLIITDYAGAPYKEAMQAVDYSDYKRVIVTVHFYAPYDFTSDKTGNVSWSAGKKNDTNGIDTFRRFLQEIFINNGIPVIVTEFGCAQKEKNNDLRRDWTEYYLNSLSSIGVHSIWWDNGHDKALFDRETGEALDPELIEIITRTRD